MDQSHGNIEDFEKVLDIMDESKEDSTFKKVLKEELLKGLSYPKAKSNSLEKVAPEYKDFLSSNNILGLEYIKALKKINSIIVPITIKRKDSAFIDENLNKKSNITSATSLRNILNENTNLKNNEDLKLIENYVPNSTLKILEDFKCENKYFPNLKNFEKEIIYTLNRLSFKEFGNIPDVYEGLEYKIKKAALNCSSLEELVENIKSKRYTLSRINRILVSSLLGITKQDLEMSKNITPYVRILGFSKSGKELISKIVNQNPNINLVTSVKSFENSLSDSNLKRMLDIDIFSTNVYNLILKKKNTNDYNGKLLEI